MKRKTYLLLGFLLAAAVGSAAFWNFSARTAAAQKSDETFGAVTQFNARSEFSLTQGGTSGVWNYGYSTSDTDNTFNFFTTTRTGTQCGSATFEDWYDSTNTGDGTPVMTANVSGASCLGIPPEMLFVHPGPTGRRTVLRWTAPSAGIFQIAGAFQKQNPSATTDLKILKNAAAPGETVLYAASLGSDFQQTFNFTVAVAAGDKLDFSVGFGNGSYFSDGSLIAVNIGQTVTTCLAKPANQTVWLPGENSAIDVESLNTNASLVGDAAYETGKIGRAFKFDGDGDYVRVEDNAAQKPANQLTIEGWFKLNATGGGLPHLVSKPLRNSAENSYAVWLNGGLRVGYKPIGSGFVEYATGYQPPVGVWNHYAFVLNTDDAGAGANTARLYVNGFEVYSGAASEPVYYNGINDALAPHPLLIGAEFENNNPIWSVNGLADEVSIYSRALAQSEIFEIVKRGAYGKCPNAACAPAPPGLISWYPGEQNALDAKSNNHGALQGNATFVRGKVGQGIKLDGNFDSVAVPDAANLRPANISVETWVKFDSMTSTVTGGAPAGYQVLVFKKNSRAAGSGWEAGYNLVKNGNDTFGWGFNSASTQTMSADSTTVAQVGEWYHVVGTYDGANIKMYVNGQLEGTAPATFPIDHSNSPLFLGSSEIPFNGFLNGTLDETAIYDRALTAAEVQAIYNAGSSGKCKPVAVNAPPNQFLWLTGDGESTDFVGLNANGVLHGNTNYKVGRVGQSFALDGSGDYVEIPDNPLQRPASAVTIEGWFKLNNLVDDTHFVSKPLVGSDSNSYVIWYSGGQLRGGHGNQSGGFETLFTGFLPNLNTWYHFAYTIDDAADTHKFFVNGVEIASAASTLPLFYDTAPHPLLIGAEYGPPAIPYSFVNGQMDEISVYSRALSASEISAIYNAGAAGKLKAKTVSVAPAPFTNRAKPAKIEASSASLVQPASVEISDATVTFANLMTSGTVTESGIDLGLLPPLPNGATYTGLAYDIATTAGYQNGAADDVRVCFNVPALNGFNFANLRILHLENGAWVNRTAASNTSPNLCTDNLTSLSPFAIVENLAPTAANVSIAGKIADDSGVGIGGVIVTLTDARGTSVSTRSNNFGRYSFGNVRAGEIYIVSVNSRRYTFGVSSQAVNLQEAIENLDFTANSESLKAGSKEFESKGTKIPIQIPE